MKVILQKNIPSLGDEGEIKVVRNGYARNFLLPNRLAKAFTKGSLKFLRHQSHMIERKNKKRELSTKETGEKLKSLEQITIEASVAASGKLYGSVSSHQISEKLRESGFSIHRNKIDLQGTRIRSLGEYQVKIKLLKDLIVEIPLSIVALEEKKKERKVMKHQKGMLRQTRPSKEALTDNDNEKNEVQTNSEIEMDDNPTDIPDPDVEKTTENLEDQST